MDRLESWGIDGEKTFEDVHVNQFVVHKKLSILQLVLVKCFLKAVSNIYERK